jgi:hypothetical protein
MSRKKKGQIANIQGKGNSSGPELQGRGSAGRDRTGQQCENYRKYGQNDQAIRDRNNGDAGRLRRYSRAGRRAEGTEMSTGRSESQIGAKMELGRQEDNTEQQSNKDQTMPVNGHVGS